MSWLPGSFDPDEPNEGDELNWPESDEFPDDEAPDRRDDFDDWLDNR